MKILLEFPLTLSVCVFLFFSFFIIQLAVPQQMQMKYFVSYPGSYNAVNWFLASINHASFGHLLSNLMFLFFLGRSVEYKVGKGKWLLFYSMAALVSGLADSMIRGAMGDRVPAVGASGAIAGIAAVSALLCPYTMPAGGKKIPFPVFIVSWLAVYYDFTNLFSRDNVAHWAHLAGFFSVFLTAYMLSEEDRHNLRMGFMFNLVFFSLTIILLYFVENR